MYVDIKIHNDDITDLSQTQANSVLPPGRDNNYSNTSCITSKFTSNCSLLNKSIASKSKQYTLSNKTVYFDQFLDIKCSYIKPEFLNNDYLETSDNDISILHNNICSLPSNFHKMEELFIESSKLPNILAFSETKLNASSSIPHLKGYNFERNDSTSAAGGVAFYISEKIQYTVNNELALNLPHCEDIWVTITNDSSSNSKPNSLEKLVIAVIYRHPGRKYDEFREKLCD